MGTQTAEDTTGTTINTSTTVNTVLGPVPAQELGVVAVHEALLSVVPGAEHAFDITIDRAEIFQTLAAKLTEFRGAGGGTIVDSTGMFHGRDVKLYEALSRTTGVHIVASTGQGPEEMLGGYFLTPQTNPPTPWPADRFADLFAQEITEGMVVPRVERRGPAGLVATAATLTGMTATDESLLRGAARAALATGVPVSLRHGHDAVRELDTVLDEKLPADRVVVGGLDRKDAVAASAPLEVARRGAYVAIDHVGTEDGARITDAERAALVAELVEAGFGDRILLSSSSTGVAKGHEGNDVSYGHVLSAFVPLLKARGLSDEEVQRILVANPRALLSVR
ncbi:phosphotriesterase-related protein [Actinocorallia herbida]|uniref:Phosphotriesterase-related protein n=1 Tax=Actinocorallia herbida TaxID=58109 RepID=A0A3N1CPY0_9ACTN|nr:phosphotriesterase [Actinocorallia herbida]ROO83333.1 phosphotriesterase-related protein [Actinocorallia herbida]